LGTINVSHHISHHKRDLGALHSACQFAQMRVHKDKYTIYSLPDHHLPNRNHVHCGPHLHTTHEYIPLQMICPHSILVKNGASLITDGLILRWNTHGIQVHVRRDDQWPTNADTAMTRAAHHFSSMTGYCSLSIHLFETEKCD
jgi:hypothetical protein